MMLLTSQDVSYCKAAANTKGKVDKRAGLVYNNNLFILVKKYELDELDVAIKEYRENFLDNEEIQVPSLMVKGTDVVGIWVHDNTFQPILETGQHSFIKTKNTKVQSNLKHLDIEYIVSEMRGEDGLKIKTRRYKLKLHNYCFLGNEAVDWLVDYLNITREKAVIIGQNLVTKKIIHHVLDEHFFKDEPLLYRFYEDEEKNMWTSNL